MANKRGRPTLLEQAQSEGALVEEATEGKYRLRLHKFSLAHQGQTYVVHWWYGTEADEAHGMLEYDVAKTEFLDMWVSRIIGAEARRRTAKNDRATEDTKAA